MKTRQLGDVIFTIWLPEVEKKLFGLYAVKKWTHIVVTYNNKTRKKTRIYINGVETK